MVPKLLTVGVRSAGLNSWAMPFAPMARRSPASSHTVGAFAPVAERERRRAVWE
jgi:hypothetical protein